MTIEQLRAILPPPAVRTEVAEREDWAVIEQRLGTRLPADYKAFIDLYGSGTIDGFIWIHSPFSRSQYVHLEYQFRRTGEILAELAHRGEAIPFSYFPSPGGLFACGTTDNGDTLYWKTDGDPDAWTVVVNEARGPEWDCHAMSMTHFLTQILTNRLACSVFPDDFSDEVPNFTTEDDA